MTRITRRNFWFVQRSPLRRRGFRLRARRCRNANRLRPAKDPRRIPITMCHGVRPQGDTPLTAAHLDRLMGVASEMGSHRSTTTTSTRGGVAPVDCPHVRSCSTLITRHVDALRGVRGAEPLRIRGNLFITPPGSKRCSVGLSPTVTSGRS